MTRAAISIMMGLAFSAVVPARAQTYTLGAAVDAVLQRNPGVASAGYRFQEADAALRETRMRRLPSLGVNSSFTRGDNPVYVFGTLMNQRSFTQADFAIDQLNNPGLTSNFRNSIEVGVPLFTGFELQSSERLGGLGRDAAASSRDSAAQNARYAVVESFLGVLLEQELAKALSERIEASSAEIENARKLKEKGLVLGSDYFAAQATLGGLRAWHSRVGAGLDSARSKLSTLMGVAPQGLGVAGSLAYGGCSLQPEGELVDRALRQRPELRQAALQEEAAGVLRRQSGLSLLPKVEAFGALETDTRDFNGNPWNKIFGVRANLPLGDPAYPSRRSKAQAALEVSRAEARRMQEGVRIEVAQLYGGYRGACESLPIARDTVDKAKQSLELFRPLYREGRQSILEVLRAEEAMARAQAAYLDNLYGLHAGRARLLLAAGELDGPAVGELERGLGAGR
ncbi:MAG: TolC family protein [Elusimicrobia bacterium]|nr:TolC family protein [Elusimicrobiota bacterium]